MLCTQTCSLPTLHEDSALQQQRPNSNATRDAEKNFRRRGIALVTLFLMIAFPLLAVSNTRGRNLSGGLFDRSLRAFGKDSSGDNGSGGLQTTTSPPTTSPTESPVDSPTPSPTTEEPTTSPTAEPTPKPTLPQFFETVPDMPNGDIASVMSWIKEEVTAIKVPFCWKDTYGRGVGLIPQLCPGRDRIGALCYSKCPAGYTRFGFDCHQNCPAGFRDDGLFCRLAEYGRGAGYPWHFGDALNNSGMIARCEADHGKGNCEMWGAVAYPKCKSGYSPFGCCICRPTPPNCAALGMNGAIDLSCAKKLIIGDPIPMSCESYKDTDAGLCYPKCKQGFYGVGPVCWSSCGNSRVDCGAACSSSVGECVSGVVDQVIAPLILAANIASFGLATPATAGATTTIKVAGKTVSGSTKLGRAMVTTVVYLQSIKPGLIDDTIEVTRKLVNPKTGQFIRDVHRTIDVSTVAFEAMEDFLDAFVEDFAGQTSPAIERQIDEKFHPGTARFIKESWATVQLEEMKEAESWDIASNVLDAVSLIDITGVTGVVAAYANPICNAVVPFPCIDAVVSACR